ncbi:hypothetical protein VB779_16015 [Haloarculaceae archaeon H-GB11]|nr:hypothetical protein [Haloarculaceae archaeon H-GB11]
MTVPTRRVLSVVLFGTILVTATLAMPVVSTTAAKFAGLESHSKPANATAVDGCRAITEPGTYVLTKDIKNGDSGENFTFISEACLRIQSSDVTLDGGGTLSTDSA